MAKEERKREVSKVKLPPDYPPEEGRYLRGNDYSPVAVVVILNTFADQIPSGIEMLVRVSIESGAALAGTLQTENIGIEKIICNLIANPNIRYVLLCGPESPGHLTGNAFAALAENGVDQKKNIMGTESPTPYLFNIPIEWIDRFRDQITLINLLNEGDPDTIRKAVWSCYQEEPTKFEDYTLFDIGAYPEPPICSKITWRVRQPWTEPKDEEERKKAQELRDLMAEIREKVEGKENDQNNR